MRTLDYIKMYGNSFGRKKIDRITYQLLLEIYKIYQVELNEPGRMLSAKIRQVPFRSANTQFKRATINQAFDLIHVLRTGGRIREYK